MTVFPLHLVSWSSVCSHSTQLFVVQGLWHAFSQLAGRRPALSDLSVHVLIEEQQIQRATARETEGERESMDTLMRSIGGMTAR